MAKRPKRPIKPPDRVVTLPNGKTIRVEAGVGEVTQRDGEWAVCALGLILRLGQHPPIASKVAAEWFPAFELIPDVEERPAPGEMLCGRPVFAWVTQAEAAKHLQLSTRQVANLESKGLPSKGAARSISATRASSCAGVGISRQNSRTLRGGEQAVRRSSKGVTSPRDMKLILV